jgi:hypothetical protein
MPSNFPFDPSVWLWVMVLVSRSRSEPIRTKSVGLFDSSSCKASRVGMR